MRAMLIESVNDYFSNKSIENFKYKLYDKLEKLYDFISKSKLNKAQIDFFKLIDFVGLGINDKINISDIEKLDNDRLFILNNGINNLFDDYDINLASVHEAYEPKDLKRIKDFSKKSGGDFQKEVALARQMSNTLKDVNKAIGRAEAAAEVYGEFNEISQIFYEKAKQLGYDGPIPGERLKQVVLGSKLSKDQQYKNKYRDSSYRSMSRSRFHGDPILPLGKVDIRSGECKYFNVYDTWGDSHTTVEVWRDNKGIDTSHLTPLDTPKQTGGIADILKPKSKEEIQQKTRNYFNYKIIFTSGNEPIHEIGEKQSFYHDQNGGNIGTWEMVDYVPLKHMSELILPYGSHLQGYTYK